MKKFSIVSALIIALAICLSACGAEPAIRIALPNDTTNEARALLLLEANGVIKLKEGAGIVATKNDIAENPFNVEIVEVEAAQLPNVLRDVDYAVINSNYAISAGLNPLNDSLLIEGGYSAYNNILCVKEGNEDSPKTKALVAALSSEAVRDFIEEKYGGQVVCVLAEPGSGFDDSVDYSSIGSISVAASPAPHAEILAVAAELLAQKGVRLDIQEFSDYVVPNSVVEDGSADANFFQHLPYLNDFNAEKGTHIVSVLDIHVEPMGLYGGKQSDLRAISK